MAATPCIVCGVVPRLDVYSCREGYFVGTWCDCGEHTRQSRVFPTHEDAQKAMDIMGARAQVGV